MQLVISRFYHHHYHHTINIALSQIIMIKNEKIYNKNIILPIHLPNQHQPLKFNTHNQARGRTLSLSLLFNASAKERESRAKINQSFFYSTPFLDYYDFSSFEKRGEVKMKKFRSTPAGIYHMIIKSFITRQKKVESICIIMSS